MHLAIEPSIMQDKLNKYRWCWNCSSLARKESLETNAVKLRIVLSQQKSIEIKWIQMKFSAFNTQIFFFFVGNLSFCFVLTELMYTRALMEAEIIFCFTPYLKQGQNSY